MLHLRKILLLILLFPIGLTAQEICDNGIDDDGDGLIDLNDATDCTCSAVAVPSLIPNPSFEQMNCCPSSYSQVSCASGWAQATSPTSDYMNTCGFIFGAATSAGLTPPDGNGMLGAIFSPGWQEYVGSCLSQPMLAGQTYTMQFNLASTPIDNQGGVCNGGVVNFGPIDITLYGLASCPAFPIATGTCPPGWTNLGSVNYTPVASWGIVSITFTPATNINAIILGSPCSLPADYNNPGGCYPYFYFDNLLLNESSMFASITQTGNWCNNDVQLSTTAAPATTYQWYLDGVALVGETSTTLNVSTNNYGIGNYTIVASSGGTCASMSDSVVMPTMPAPNFSAPATCFNNTSQFTDNSTISTGTITNWNWNFGDGNTSTTQNPTNTYTSPGTYTTTLIVTSDINCVDSIQIPVTVNPLPSSLFDVSNASGNGDGTYGFCLYDNVMFSDLTSITPGNITSWLWDFGDGNTSTLQNPSNNYATEGNYLVELLVTSDSGCLDSITIPVYINPPPVAGFTFLNDCYYNAADFTDASTISSGNLTGWTWDFGDGNSSTSQNPSNLYTIEGLYTVTQIVTSDSGCLDTAINTIERFPKPVASFTAPNVCLGTQNCFADASTVSSGTITGWDWNFGTGYPPATTQNPCNLFTTDGTHDVTLIATSDNNCKDTTVVTIDVYDLPSVDFTFTPNCVNEPPTVFTDNSTVNYGVTSNWTWNFGDGNSSIIQNPSNTFSQDGTYNTTLIVTSTNGCIDSITKPITIFAKPLADFSFVNDCQQNVANFTDQSTGNIVNWNWDFGDGNTSTTQNPTNQYNVDGNFQVSLITTNTDGCSDTVSYATIRYPSPFASFSIPNVCLNDSSCFTDLSSISSGSIASWIWNFGDGSPMDNSTAPCHAYSNYGTYSVSLILTSDMLCFDDTTITTEVYPLPTAGFTNTTVCENTPPTSFTNTSSVVTGGVSGWQWDFGTSTSDLQNPTYNFVLAGTYPVELIAITELGCRDTITQNVSVLNMPTAGFDADVYNGCIDFCVNFTDTSSSNAGSIDTWEWDFGNFLGSNTDSAFTCYTVDGSYDVSLIVSNNLGCYDTATYSNYITAYPLPVADFTFSPYPASIYDPEVFFTNNSTDAETWVWDFGDSTYNTTTYSPSHIYGDTGHFYVQLDVYNQYNCHDSTMETVWIMDEFSLFIPNAVTPNGDGINDEFFITGSGYVMDRFEFMIFDRWGQLIYHTKTLTPWDCTYNGLPVQQDVYVYKVIISDLTHKVHEIIGHVNVLR